MPSGTSASGTEGVRRPLSLACAAGSGGYLVASIAQWPRSGIAIGSGSLGIAALMVLAAAGGTRSLPLFAAQLMLVAIALGAVNAAMLLGHWYLVTPKLSPAPLRRMMWLLMGALIIQAFAFAIALLAVGTDPLTGGMAWLTWLRLGTSVV